MYFIGEISVDGAAKRWKSLRDTFMKIIAEERQPSGSGRASKRKKWRFYDQMCFVRDTLSNTPYVNSISVFLH